MKMIPRSAWVSLSAGALLIGLEYIAPAVVTAAGNIAPHSSSSSSPAAAAAAAALLFSAHGCSCPAAFVPFSFLSFPISNQKQHSTNTKPSSGSDPNCTSVVRRLR